MDEQLIELATINRDNARRYDRERLESVRDREQLKEELKEEEIPLL